MSPSLLRLAASIAGAHRTLDYHRSLAKRARGNDALHRLAMKRVFLCEDSLFLLVETHDMIARLEAQRTTPGASRTVAADVKAASDF